jgi:hypothetical protein
MALANETDTTPTEVNLSNSYWQIWSGYSGAVKSFVKTNESEDSVTLTLTTKGGGSFPVTFKKAAVKVGSVTLAYNGRPTSVLATVKSVNGGQLY